MLSYVSAMAASIAGLEDIAMYLGAPAIFIAGWLFFGHLVTLDDDMPGEWSNSNASKKVWLLSLGELALKAIIFLSLLLVVYLSGVK